MKNKLLISFLLIIAIVVCAFNFFVVNVDRKDSAIARYIYKDKNIEVVISAEDMSVIAEILDGKSIDVFALPACGFDENVAVIINNKTFCIACDECGAVYLKERNGYISLESDENEQLRNILHDYGFEWPCN